MEDMLLELQKRIKELELEMINPEIISDQQRFKTVKKEYSSIIPIVKKYEERIKLVDELNGATDLLNDEKDVEMKELLISEIAELRDKIDNIDEELVVMLLPKDPNSGKDIIMEIRAGTGGDEASLFAADLLRMYTRYADSEGWGIDIIYANPTGIDGYKEIILSLRSEYAFDNLKFESGVHRVQRIPSTESSGRIHTSAVTVAVLAEAEESELMINPDEIRVDVYRSSGHGGQSVNTTDSAVRITHIPTGIVVTCQDEKSQHKNKAKAIRVLRARLMERIKNEKMKNESQLRRSQIGSGDRSEKIRTYNFPQSRVTDHRIGLTLYSLEDILGGALNLIIEPLKKSETELQLQSAKK